MAVRLTRKAPGVYEWRGHRIEGRCHTWNGRTGSKVNAWLVTRPDGSIIKTVFRTLEGVRDYLEVAT